MSELKSVVAKFICQRLENQKYAGGENTKIVLTAVTVYNSPEDKPFWDATPAGQIELSTVNQFAAAHFVPGKKYYVTFAEISE